MYLLWWCIGIWRISDGTKLVFDFFIMCPINTDCSVEFLRSNHFKWLSFNFYYFLIKLTPFSKIGELHVQNLIWNFDQDFKILWTWSSCSSISEKSTREVEHGVATTRVYTWTWSWEIVYEIRLKSWLMDSGFKIKKSKKNALKVKAN